MSPTPPSPPHLLSEETTPLLKKPSDGHRAEGGEDLADPKKLAKRTRNCILGAVWMGVFLGALDTTIVASLVSDVSSSFEKSNQASWLGTSYLLSTATFTPLYGRFCDIFGRRNAVLLAIVLFTSGTALCGFAPSMISLIIGRLIAGMGGGGMMACSSIIASDLIPLKQRALAQGLANLFFGAGAGLGGPIGGIISDSIGWRYAFILQLPLLAICLGFVLFFVKYTVPGQGKSKREMIRRVDYLGSLSLILSLGSLLFALSYKNNENLAWGNPLVWGPLIVFGVFTVVFVLVEAYVSPEPIMPLRILVLRNGIFVSLVNFFLSMVSFSTLYFLPMFFEIVKRQSASFAGAHLIPNSVALSCGSLFAGWWIRRTGKYWKLIAITSFCPVLSMIALSLLSQKSGWFQDWISVIGVGFGISSVVTAVLITLIASVDRADMATATGTTYLFRYIGQVVGVALSSSLLQSVLNSQLQYRIKGKHAAELIEDIRHVASHIPNLPKEIQIQAIASYEISLRAVFIFNAVIAFLCFLCTIPLVEYPLPNTFEEEDEQRRQRELAQE